MEANTCIPLYDICLFVEGFGSLGALEGSCSLDPNL